MDSTVAGIAAFAYGTAAMFLLCLLARWKKWPLVGMETTIGTGCVIITGMLLVFLITYFR